jgi:hypothetical protein
VARGDIITYMLRVSQPSEVYVLKEEKRPDLDSWSLASPLHTQQTPFNTIMVNINTFEAYKVMAFDPSETDAPYYGLVPIHSDGNVASAPYFWTYLPEPQRFLELGLNTPALQNKLILDQDTMTYILAPAHRHHVHQAQDPDSDLDSDEDDLPQFNPNRSDLPPFAEGGAAMPDSHIPRTGRNTRPYSI